MFAHHILHHSCYETNIFCWLTFIRSTYSNVICINTQEWRLELLKIHCMLQNGWESTANLSCRHIFAASNSVQMDTVPCIAPLNTGIVKQWAIQQPAALTSYVHLGVWLCSLQCQTDPSFQIWEWSCMPMCTLEHQTPLYLYLWDIHYYKPQPLIELILQ